MARLVEILSCFQCSVKLKEQRGCFFLIRFSCGQKIRFSRHINKSYKGRINLISENFSAHFKYTDKCFTTHGVKVSELWCYSSWQLLFVQPSTLFRKTFHIEEIFLFNIWDNGSVWLPYMKVLREVCLVEIKAIKSTVVAPPSYPPTAPTIVIDFPAPMITALLCLLV